MARLVFLLGVNRDRVLRDIMIESDFCFIDMGEVRRKYSNSGPSEVTDRLVCRTFSYMLRRIPPRCNIVVDSFPRNEREIHSILKYLGQGYRPLFIVSKRTSRSLKEKIEKKFPGSVKKRRLEVPT